MLANCRDSGRMTTMGPFYRTESFRLGLAVALLAAAYLLNLSRPALWGDEANTGNLAKNTLRAGYPTAFDGKNLSVADNLGIQYNRNFVSKRVPWVQFYVGALSIKLFGASTLGLRLLFAIIGLFAVFPLYGILRTRVTMPAFFSALILAVPQIVMFQRNARYFPIVIFLYALIVWLMLREGNRTWRDTLLAALLFVLLYHTHNLAGIALTVTLGITWLLYRERTWGVYFLASLAGLLSWIVWYVALGPQIGDFPMVFSELAANPSFVLSTMVASVFDSLLDLDAVDVVPFIAWAGVVLAFLITKRTATLAAAFKDPLFAIVLINYAVLRLVIALTLGYEDQVKNTLMRYVPHLLPFLVVLLFVLVDRAARHKAVIVVASLAIVGFNIFTVSLYLNPLKRPVALSWALPVYGEIVRPPASPFERFLAFARRLPYQPGRTIISKPLWINEILIYYLGNRYTVIPVTEKSALSDCVLEKVGPTVFDRYVRRAPAVFLDLAGSVDHVSDRYREVSFPSHIEKPDDGTRPELTQHSFARRDPLGYFKVFVEDEKPPAPPPQP
jgi:hypothetical protein